MKSVPYETICRNISAGFMGAFAVLYEIVVRGTK